MNDKSSNSNFFQPIISVFGLGISLITAILPLFSREILTALFMNKILARPVSFLAFMIGIAIIWQISEFQPYISFTFGKLKKRGNEYPEYWKVLSVNSIVWFLLFFSVCLSFFFFYLGSLQNPSCLSGILQALVYLVFFLTLITIFSVLFAQTKQRFTWQSDRENFPITIFETLEKNRLVKPGIEIYENKSLTQEEAGAIGINTFGAKKMKIRTISQADEIIEFVISSDGKEIIQVLKKERQKD